MGHISRCLCIKSLGVPGKINGHAHVLSRRRAQHGARKPVGRVFFKLAILQTPTSHSTRVLHDAMCYSSWRPKLTTHVRPELRVVDLMQACGHVLADTVPAGEQQRSQSSENTIPDSGAQYAILLDLRNKIRVTEANLNHQSDELRAVVVAQQDQLAADQQGEDKLTAVQKPVEQLRRPIEDLRLVHTEQLQRQPPPQSQGQGPTTSQPSHPVPMSQSQRPGVRQQPAPSQPDPRSDFLARQQEHQGELPGNVHPGSARLPEQPRDVPRELPGNDPAEGARRQDTSSRRSPGTTCHGSSSRCSTARPTSGTGSRGTAGTSSSCPPASPSRGTSSRKSPTTASCHADRQHLRSLRAGWPSQYGPFNGAARSHSQH